MCHIMNKLLHSMLQFPRVQHVLVVLHALDEKMLAKVSLLQSTQSNSEENFSKITVHE